MEIIEIIEEISSIGKKPINEVEVEVAEAAIRTKSSSNKRERPAGPFIGSSGSRKRRKRSVLDDETEAFLSSRMKSLSWRSEEEGEKKDEKQSSIQSTSEVSKALNKAIFEKTIVKLKVLIQNDYN